MDFYSLYSNCRLCPRNCGINRLDLSGKGNKGFCGQDSHLRVSYIGPHFGEEPPISGLRGSGTVFLSGCSLKCTFCQNYQISRDGLGSDITSRELLESIIVMIETKKVHNINFVTPDHFFPHVFDVIKMLREKKHDIPTVFNLSGYQSLEMLKIACGYADIYMPDFKYSNADLAVKLSRCGDYTQKAIDAVYEMVRQKGFLEYNEEMNETAQRGVLVRHLILPGNTENSTGALDTLYLEFGPRLPVSLMSQYHPVIPHEDSDMNRKITIDEFETVYNHALDLGFENLFVQFPEEYSETEKENEKSGFLPDFNLDSPFS